MQHIYYLFGEDDIRWLAKLRSSDCAVEFKVYLGLVKKIEFVSDWDLIGICTDKAFNNPPAYEHFPGDGNTGQTWSIVKAHCDLLFNSKTSFEDNTGVVEIVRTNVKVAKMKYSFQKSNRELVMYVLDDGSIHLIKFQSSVEKNVLSIQVLSSKEIFKEFKMDEDHLSVYGIDEIFESKKNFIEQENKEESITKNYDSEEASLTRSREFPIFERSSSFSEESHLGILNESMLDVKSLHTNFHSKNSSFFDNKKNIPFEKMPQKNEVLLISETTKDLYFYCKWTPDQTKNTFFYLTIFAKLGKFSKRIKIRMEESSLNRHKRLKILEVPNKVKQAHNCFDFLIYSDIEMLLMTFDTNNKSLEVVQMAFVNSQRELDVLYCPHHNLFLVPNKKYLEIWNSKLTHKIYTLQMDYAIKSLKFIPSNCTVIIYDQQK